VDQDHDTDCIKGTLAMSAMKYSKTLVLCGLCLAIGPGLAHAADPAPHWFQAPAPNSASDQPSPAAAVPSPAPIDDAKLQAALRDMRAFNHSVATPVLQPDLAQRNAIADDAALDGRFGIMAKISTAYRLGKSNMLAEMAGKAFGTLIIVILAYVVFFRKRKR